MYDYVGSAGWRSSSVYDLAVWKNGLAFKNIEFSDFGRPIIKISELKSGVTNQTARTMTEYDPSVFVQAGDMLFSWSGNPDTSIDVFRWEGEDGWLNQHIFKLTPKPDISEEFFFFVLKWLCPRFAEIARNKQTTGLGHVTVQDLKKMMVGVPDPEEQNTIVSIVGPLQRKIELNRRMNETLEAMARAIFEEVGRVSGWQPRPLNEYAAIFDGPHATPSLTPEGPVFLGISNLKSGMLDLSDTNHLSEADFQTWTRRVTPTRGDVVFSYETRLGQAALIPHGLRCCLGRRMGLLRPHHDRVAPVVLLRAYLSADFQEVIRKHTIHGATVERIPLKDMADFPIRLPNPSQNPGLADQLASLRDLVEANQSESATLAATRDLLLPRLMSGELRVKDAERAMEAAA